MSPGLDPRRTDERPRCWVCSADHLDHFRESSVARESLGASSFRITDAEYGSTMELVRCRACGFIQLADHVDVTPFYERMDDAAYELTRSSRALQAGELLEGLSPGMHGTRLLDVGAGSGVLVVQATPWAGSRYAPAARALGPRWWLYRIAHVGYFSPSTLDTLISGSGFVLEGWRRPAWYFSVGHFRTLAARLLPFLRWVPVPRAFARATVRVNLFDSMAALYRAPAQ